MIGISLDRKRLASLLFPTCVLFILFVPAPARGDLSSKEARNLIAKAGGMSLPSSSVRVKKPVMLQSTLAEVAADIDLVFRIAQEPSGVWRLKELRTGEGRWEKLEVIARASGAELPPGNCDNRDQFQRRVEGDLTARAARCLIASLFGVELPSDDVRIKSVSGFGLPLASAPSAIAAAQVRVYVHVMKDRSGWQLHALKSGSRDWTPLHTTLSAIAAIKSDLARDEMKTIAVALEKFRQERGGFVISDQLSVLIDHLSPRFLARVIRLDPWENPYEYDGTRDRFTVRSAGPDGNLNTADDVVFSVP